MHVIPRIYTFIGAPQGDRDICATPAFCSRWRGACGVRWQGVWKCVCVGGVCACVRVGRGDVSERNLWDNIFLYIYNTHVPSLTLAYSDFGFHTPHSKAQGDGQGCIKKYYARGYSEERRKKHRIFFLQVSKIIIINKYYARGYSEERRKKIVCAIHAHSILHTHTRTHARTHTRTHAHTHT
jgi:hypothetical protein